MPIPETHRDLLQGTTPGILSTIGPDGQPQSTVVWVDWDGRQVLINTARERFKARNIRRDPRVALLVVDAAHSERWISVRGRVVEMSPEGAEAHADALAARYSAGRHRRFYGDVCPAEQKQHETRVIVRIEPVKVSVDAVFK